MLYLMNWKNKLAKKDLRLAYSQGNNTTYPPNIKSMTRYLSTQYPNNKPGNQCKGKNGDKGRAMTQKFENKDSNTGGTIGAHVEDTATTEGSTAPSRGPSIATHVSETNVQPSRSSRTVEDILGAHPMNDDNFWGNTNPTDMSIDTMNSKKWWQEAISQNYTQTNTKNQFYLSYKIRYLMYQKCVMRFRMSVRPLWQIQGFKHVIKNKQCDTCELYWSHKSRKSRLLQLTWSTTHYS